MIFSVRKPDFTNICLYIKIQKYFSEMIAALNGHFSLVHSNFAPDDSKMQTKQWVVIFSF